MMDNLYLFEKYSAVPNNALKPIKGGRLSGFSDINPLWRIKSLTEAFGLCGVGWKYEITDKKIEQGADGVMCAFVDINLYIKVDGEWSEAIPGTGGSEFVSKEKGGLYTSDECFKMAMTDAISVACKSLGFGADVYWNTTDSKYQNKDCAEPKKTEPLTVETAAALAISFGKHSGKTLKEIYKEDRNYIEWLSASEKTDARIKEAITILNGAIKKAKEPHEELDAE